MFENTNVGLKLAALIILCVVLVFLKELVSLLVLFILVLIINIRASTLKQYKLFIVFLALPILVYVITKNLTNSISWFKGILRLSILLLSGWIFASTSNGYELVKLLNRMKFPQKVSFALGISLQFLPKIVSEYATILGIIKNRFDLKPTKVIKQHNSYVRIFMIPIIIRCVQIGDEIAQAAELKGFGAPISKKYTSKITLKKSDYFFICTFILLIIFILLINFLLKKLIGV
ncbi:MAG: energy-coupling factor transporter transmembrane component T family protein [Minisyncoccia bacterium]